MNLAKCPIQTGQPPLGPAASEASRAATRPHGPRRDGHTAAYPGTRSRTCVYHGKLLGRARALSLSRGARPVPVSPSCPRSAYVYYSVHKKIDTNTFFFFAFFRCLNQRVLYLQIWTQFDGTHGNLLRFRRDRATIDLEIAFGFPKPQATKASQAAPNIQTRG